MHIIGISVTGSGKTLAFLLPMIQHVLARTAINEGRGGPIGLVISPTRKLEIQIFVAAHPFCKAVGFKAICLSGGNNYHQQEIQLSNGVNVAVCTPRRLIQLKNINVLLPTNFGARGFVIAEVRNVIYYDAVNKMDIHIHQISTTGRAGQSGIA
uniref:ATP-dependent RNA helicase n=1 Tax=Panagrolaimus davidi TaxID=227884 RepID=A0A914R136_9BILA